MSEVQQTPAELLPVRLHHNAWVVEDQARTRHFYEDVLGMPLTQFWIEEAPFEGQKLVLSHAFYGMQDGSALAFFCMAEPKYHERFKSPVTEMFNHVALKVDRATQDRLLERIIAAGYKNFSIEHGYCRSVYVTDPDGLRLEFTLDALNVEEINSVQARTARETLDKWIAGHRETNNNWRH
jgi:glyoxylase I family protein